ncbi:MAG TPA: translation initiation factor [Syntrophales bacterium]|nr:translation initiation factor [Syntrophales bacterium]
MSDEKSKLVYSTEKLISRKEIPVKTLQASVSAAIQKVIVRLDKKGRRGKTVTVIDGLQMPQEKMEELLGQLKVKLGTGGTIKKSSLEIQGDHRSALVSLMKDMGFSTK